jgi:predicted aminopeptidase
MFDFCNWFVCLEHLQLQACLTASYYLIIESFWQIIIKKKKEKKKGIIANLVLVVGLNYKGSDL